MVVGRGTNDPDANSNVSKVARMLWEGMGFGWRRPAIRGLRTRASMPGWSGAARLGFSRIVVFPYFLFTGVLVRRIYDQADEVAAAHPGISFVKAPYLNDHPLVLDSFAERVRGALTGDNLMNCALCKYRSRSSGGRTRSARRRRAITTMCAAADTRIPMNTTIPTSMGTTTPTSTDAHISA